MNALLSEISMSIGTAFAYYGLRIIMFAATAAIGITIGIKISKKKNTKEQ